tara:strand:- start:201 stop:623 length:423 start_codon:yes stop_codon:yes gene_type:complete
MKKVLYYIFIALLTINLTSCGSVPISNGYGTIKGWAYKEIPPSQVDTSREDFFEGKLSDGRTFSIGEYIGGRDGEYYYNSFYQDMGWYSKDDDTWSAPAGSYRPLRGRLYFSLKREVAIYLYPKGTYNAFRVTINPKEDN